MFNIDVFIINSDISTFGLFASSKVESNTNIYSQQHLYITTCLYLLIVNVAL